MPCLIADSGATKTDWRLVGGGGERHAFSTRGLNPHHLTEAGLRHELALAAENVTGTPVQTIHFYGAGCTADKTPLMASLLAEAFGCGRVEVLSDMVGAARAVAGHEAALVCILGTGSNLCLWDGQSAQPGAPSLGYILGDEGSGAHIGKTLLRSALRGELPEPLLAAFHEETQLTLAEALRHVYGEPGAATWLASLAPFCARHRQFPQMSQLLEGCFTAFFTAHRSTFAAHADLPIHWVGSIACQFQAELENLMCCNGWHPGRFLKAPIDGLEAYHAGED